LLQDDPDAWLKGLSYADVTFPTLQAHATVTSGFTEAEIEEKIAQRLEARKTKNWAEADRIRDELNQAGIILEDKPDGTSDWRRG
jgi:cysteinyl-tRNA synthetase